MDEYLAKLKAALIGRLKLRTNKHVQGALDAQKPWRDHLRAHERRALLTISEAYAQEAVARADIIREEFRQSRLAWTPQQIVEGANTIRQTAHEALKETAAEFGQSLDERTGVNTMKQQGSAVRESGYDAHIGEASRAALQIVDGYVDDLIAGARADLEGRTMADKSTYHNHFHGNVAAVAQGGSTIGGVQQTNKGQSPEELAKAIETILGALDQYNGGDEKVLSAIEDLKASLATAKRGHLPGVKLLGGAVKALVDAEQLFLQAPAAVGALRHIARSVGFDLG